MLLMEIVDFSAPAEVYASRGRGVAKRPVTFHRFPTAAAAIQFVIEKLPAEMLIGTVIEIGDDRYESKDIRRLYDSADYPLERIDGPNV
jgi:hypothetical protein